MKKIFQTFLTSALLLGMSMQSAFAEGDAHEAAAHAEHSSFSSTIPFWINFVIFIAIVAFIIKKKFPGFWLSRAEQIKERVVAGLRELNEAKALLASEEKNLNHLAADKKEVRERIAFDTDRERKQIILEAETKAKRTVAQAKELAELEKRTAGLALRSEIAERALHLAEQLVTKEADSSLDKAYQNVALAAIGNVER